MQTFGWKHTGNSLPSFAIKPAKDQESVWLYPRPPAVRPDNRTVTIKIGSIIIASSNSAIKICETASPPCWYIPRNDVNMDLLKISTKTSFCEWKGRATYWLYNGIPIAWSYENPNPEYKSIASRLSFYASKCECRVQDELVIPQQSDFYGGWITREIVGPFKGDPLIAGYDQ